MTEIVPTEQGQDLVAPYKTGFPLHGYDGHVRIEETSAAPAGFAICADVFESDILDNVEAHVESECARNTEEGARVITAFLRGYGFDVTIRPNPRYR